MPACQRATEQTWPGWQGRKGAGERVVRQTPFFACRLVVVRAVSAAVRGVDWFRTAPFFFRWRSLDPVSGLYDAVVKGPGAKNQTERRSVFRVLFGPLLASAGRLGARG